jgi:DNA-binding CsgD family transcriptional regulator
MPLPIPQQAIQELASANGVSDAELATVLKALAGQSSQEIAQDLGISDAAVRKRLGEVYRKFGITEGGPGKLARLEKVLQDTYHPAALSTGMMDVPDFSVEFYGRTQELEELQRWIITDRVQVLALIGMGGMGKTMLAARLAHQVKSEFVGVMWRSLSSDASITHLLMDLGQKIGLDFNLEELSNDVDELVELILEVLKKQRYLIILDDFEAILREKDRYGRYKREHDDYEILVSRMAKETHQSCLLICGQERPKEVMLLAQPTGLVREYVLTGLNIEDAKQILQDKQLYGEKEWDSLIKLYRGNPLALHTVSSTIQEIFNGDVEEFIHLKTTLVSGDYLQVLKDHFQRLSTQEEEIIKYLTKNGSASIAELRQHIHLDVSSSDLIESLQSLKGRSLLEQHPNEKTFSLQPAVKRYAQKHYFAS